MSKYKGFLGARQALPFLRNRLFRRIGNAPGIEVNLILIAQFAETIRGRAGAFDAPPL
jgi:hypothetical protein